MPNTSSLAIWVLLLVATLVVSGTARAATLGRSVDFNDMRAALAQSELVFKGTVTQVRYRMSDGNADTYTKVPLTYVTYKVESVIRGNWTEDTITVRFFGGASGIDGRVLIVPHQPIFKTGDIDVLLLADNGSSHCPTVNCAAGRFRLVGRKVYSNAGNPVVSFDGDRIAIGNQPLRGDVVAMTVPAAPQSHIDELRRRLETLEYVEDRAKRAALEKLIAEISAPRTLSKRNVGAASSSNAEAAITDTEFMRAISAVAAKAGPPSVRARSAGFDEEVLLPLPQRGTLKVARPAPREIMDNEQRLLEQNGGNPVIPKR